MPLSLLPVNTTLQQGDGVPAHRASSDAVYLDRQVGKLYYNVSGLIWSGVSETGVIGVTANFGGTAAENGARLLAAKTAAVSGETINVGPGTYATNGDLAKNGVDWFFAPGAIIDKTTNTPSVAIFDDASGPITCKIRGYGQFVVSAPSGALRMVVNQNNASSNIYIEGYLADVTGDAFFCSGGTQVVKFTSVDADEVAFYAVGSTANQSFTCDIINGNAVGGFAAITSSAGVQIGVVRALTSSGRGILSDGDGSCRISVGTCITAGSAVDIRDDVATGGSLVLQGYFKTTGTNADCIVVSDTSKALTLLGGTVLIATGTGESVETEGSAFTFRAYSVFANKAIDASATVSITGGLTVDADVA